MSSIKLVTALVGVALAIAAPAAYAMPMDPNGAPGTTQQVPHVPPPPSSIAMSAADEYELLRAPVASTEVADEPSSPSGFDWVSAAIGAAAAAGIALVTVAALSTRRRTALG
jgi:hypothetical protein